MTEHAEIVRWAAMVISLLLAATFVAVVAIDHRRRLDRQAEQFTGSGGVALRPDAGGGRLDVPSGPAAACTSTLDRSSEEGVRG